ncbi:SpaA isopeptide-forming pilin-related protein [Crateriforma conspicua]|uniref:SpaA isopeptide-forming pilin-related protein n=1 Tax=Crateriforma conspicua TaxID=2527996 RepID=UPI001E4FABF1|nr:SpaA isopeptide-forming pilin-related protein [Crateriforma conspicua]
MAKASRWASRMDVYRQRWAEKRAARIQRYREAFRGSWIYRIGLGVLAIWNAIVDAVPFEITRRKAPVAPYLMMGLPFAIGPKRKRRKSKRQASKSDTKARLNGLDKLEDRRLLAAQAVGDWEQMFNSSSNPITETVTAQIDKVPAGGNAAIAIAANFTETSGNFNGMDVTIKVDNDGDGVFSASEIFTTVGTNSAHLKSLSDPAGSAFPGSGEGEFESASNDAGNDQVGTAVYIHPIGSSPIDRKVEVTLTSGNSTDIIASIGSYLGVNQGNPVVDSATLGQDEFLINTPGGLMQFDYPGSSVDVGPVAEGHAVLDSTHARYANGTASATTDPALMQALQAEVLNDQDADANIAGGASVLPTTASAGGPGLMEWAYNAQPGVDGAVFSAHVAVEIADAANNDVEYDFGDAGTFMGTDYDTTLAADGPRHAVVDANGDAIVGPYFGSVAPDDEIGDGTVDNSAATKDDNSGNADEDGIVSYGNDGATTPGVFVSHSMSTTAGTVNLDIQGVSAAQPGYVSAWIDWDGDGSFTASESIANGVMVTTAGTLALPVSVPTTADVTDKGSTILRIRVFSDPCDMVAPGPNGERPLGPTGHANDGEVEDHRIDVVRGAEISGVKLEDLTGDGPSADDTPLDNVQIVLTYDSGNPVVDALGNPVSPVLTGPNGEFSFSFLTPSDYIVSENLSGDFLYAGTPDGMADDMQGLSVAFESQDSNMQLPTSFDVTLTNTGLGGLVEDDITFRNYIAGSVHGVKFEDLDGDGTFDYADGERGLEGVGFQIYRFAGTNTTVPFSGADPVNTFDWELAGTEFTNVHGEYWFTGLRPGQYVVRENLDLESTVLSVDLVPGGAAPFEIDGTTFEFSTGGGSPDVLIDISGLTTTDEVAQAAGTAISEALGIAVRVDGSNVIIAADFALVTESATALSISAGPDFSDYVLSTGQQVGAPGTDFDPIDASNTIYTINSRDELQWDDATTFETGPYVGAAYDRPLDLDADGQLTQDEIDMAILKGALKNPQSADSSLIFGNFLPVDIMGYKYEDLDNDGITGNDTYLNGVTFELVDGGGSVVATAVSGADPDGSGPLTAVDGKFVFPGVVPGDYTVREASAQDINNDNIDDVGEDDMSTLAVEGQGLVLTDREISFTVISGGLDDATKSKDKDSNDHDAMVDLTGGPGATSFDPFLNYITGSIHGLKFEDFNNDGAFQPSADPAEVGVEGVKYEIYRFVGTNTYDLNSNNASVTTYDWEKLTVTATTDEHGEFWFTGLEPGQYTVREVLDAPFDQQSSNQAEGDPSSQFDPNNFDPANLPYLGDNPATLGSSLLTITSGVELQWDSDVTYEGFPAYEGDAYNRPMDIDGNGIISPAEAQSASDAAALKTGSDALASLRWGNVTLVTLTGEKYEDLDGDGVKDNNDPAFAGIEFELVDSNNVVVDTVTTNASGVFTFTDVDPGETYTIREKANQSIDAGPDDELVKDSMVATVTVFSGDNINVTTGNGAVAVNALDYDYDDSGDFGDNARPWLNYVYGSVHGIKFEDLDGDGIKDAGEPALEDVEFTLQVKDGSNWVNVGAAVTTGANGKFAFTNLDPGQYRLIENLQTGDTLPSGDEWVSSTHTFNNAGASSTFTIESREEYVWKAGEAGLPGNSLKREELLNSGNNSLVYGNFLPVDIMGYKYEDLDNDGITGNDTYLNGVTFELVDGGGSVVATAVSGADPDGNGPLTAVNGKFVFPGVVPGDYTVREASAQDINNDNIDDVGEDDMSTLAVEGQGLVLTDREISFTVISGGLDDATKSKDKDSDDHDAMVDLTGGPGAGSFDPFLNYITGSIHGLKFEDFNNDGAFQPSADPAEVGVEGVKYEIYRFVGTNTYDLNSNNASVTTYDWEKLTVTATTDEHGEFWFTGLEPGQYTVREVLDAPFDQQSSNQAEGDPSSQFDPNNFDPANLPYLGDNPATLGSSLLTITSGVELQWDSDVTYEGFPAYEGDAYNRPMDIDGNGIISPAEAQSASDAAALKTGSDALASLRWGNVTLVTLTGEKYEDLDGDGVKDNNDPAFAGIEFELVDSNNVVVDTVTTNASGVFTFTDVDPGETYTIREKSNQSIDAGPDDELVKDSMVVQVTVFSGDNINVTTGNGAVAVNALDYDYDDSGDFGDNARPWLNYVYGSVHGIKFEDLDGDGIKDAGEPALEDVEFTLQVKDGSNWVNVGAAVTTGANGKFAFTNLDPGQYRLIENLQTGDTLPSGDEWVSSTHTFNNAGASSTFTIESREEYVWKAGEAGLPGNSLKREELLNSGNNSLVYGNFLPVDIMGYKYEDLDNDGITGNDTYLNGVTFELVDGGGSVVATAVSGADPDGNGPLTAVNGKFVFPGVVPGDYTVREASAQDINNDNIDDVGEDDMSTLAVEGQGLVLTDREISFTVISGGLDDATKSKDKDSDDHDAMVDLTGGPGAGSFDPFLNYITGSIHGLKFEDFNNDGAFQPSADPAEVGVEGVKYEIYRFVGTNTYDLNSNNASVTTYDWEKLTVTATTDEHGEFWFTGLEPGQYTVREVLDAPFDQQSSNQAEGDPSSQFDPNNFDPANLPYLGDNPATLGSSLLTITSGLELQWDSDVTYEGFPAYEGDAYNRPMDIDGNGIISPAEAQSASDAAALKTGSDALASLRWGNVTLVTLTGEKYEDLDGDGVKDNNDPAFAGIEFELVDSNNVVVDTVTTNASGVFTFTDVDPGETYTIREKSNQSIDAGPDDELVKDSMVATVTVFSGDNINVTTGNGAVAVNALDYDYDDSGDFGDNARPWLNYVYGSVHGIKFEDLDGDGIKDAGEPALEDVEFTLQVKDGSNWVNVGAAVTTGANGKFAFTNLDPGQYRLIENLQTGDTLPSGDEWVSSTHTFNNAGASSTFTIESREEYVWKAGEAGLPGNSLKREELLNSGNNSLVYGNYLPVDIMGYKYEDLDNDGITGNDTYLNGVTFELVDGGGSVVATAVSGADPDGNGPLTAVNGKFVFPGVVPGDYTVREASAQDINNDNIDDVGEDDMSTLAVEGQGLVLTDREISFTVISGGLDDATKSKDKDSDDHDAMVDLTGGPGAGSFDPFLNYITGSIHGLKFEDFNNDGAFQPSADPAEVGVEGVKYEIYRFVGTNTYDLNSNNASVTTYDWEKLTVTATTDEHGEFWFTGLEPGQYTVREVLDAPFDQQSSNQAEGDPSSQFDPNNFDPANLPYLGDNPATLGSSLLTITSGVELQWDSDVTYEGFPAYEGDAYNRPMDIDGNGIISPAEAQSASDAAALKTGSDALASLRWGNVTLVTLTGEKYEDLDGDGVKDNNDPAFAGIEFELVDSNNVVVDTVTTNASGVFTFTDVDPGETYTIREKSNQSIDAGPDDELVKDSMVVQVTVFSGDNINVTTGNGAVAVNALDYDYDDSGDFGDNARPWLNYVYGSVHGIKFEDLDGDGIKDAGEPALEDVEFTLQVKDGSNWVNVGAAVTTGANGKFAFTNLDPGQYRLIENLQTGDTLPSGDEWVSSTHTFNNAGASSTFTIESREEYVWKAGEAGLPGNSLKREELLNSGNNSLVYGNYLPVDIMGYKYEDLDNDGITGNDTYLNGVTFELVDGGGSVVATAVSGADPDGNGPLTAVNGKFVFPGVVPGDYTVREASAQDINNDNIDDVGEDDMSTLAVEGQGLVLTDREISFTVISGGLDDATKSKDKDSNDHDAMVDLTGGPSAGSFDPFLNYITGSIHGLKFEDFNNDGGFDPNGQNGSPEESGVEGVVFEIYKFVGTNTYDLNSNNGDAVTYDWDFVKTATTDEHGEFWFTGLEPGQYTVREVLDAPFDQQSSNQAEGDPSSQFDPNNFDPANLPYLGDNPGTLGSSLLTITSGLELQWDSDVTYEGFPAYEGDAYNRPMDIDGNGIISPAEAQSASDAAALKTGSDALASLRWGNVTLVTLTGEKYEDLDGDGVKDNNDPAFAGIEFELVDSNNVVVDTVTTNASGVFTFTDVDPGETYTIREKADQSIDAGADDELVKDSMVVQVTVFSGDNINVTDGTGAAVVNDLGYDQDGATGGLDFDDDARPFLNYVYGSVHGIKFEDLDGDGIKDAGEPALEDVEFTLQVKDGSNWVNVGAAVTTGANGKFAFTNLDPGQYRLIENLQTGDTLPSGDEWVSSTHTFNNAGASSTFTIESREEYVWKAGEAGLPGNSLKREELLNSGNNSLVYGNYLPVDIMGYKYEDLDNDGITGNDTYLNGVTFELVDGGGSVVATAVSGADPDGNGPLTAVNGKFVFPGVVPGDYTVREASAQDINNDNIDDVGEDDMSTLAVEGQGLVLTDREISFTVISGGLDDATKSKDKDSDDHDAMVDLTGGPGATSFDPFLNYITGSVHGYKFHDYDLSGDTTNVNNLVEPALEDVVFNLYRWLGSETIVLNYQNSSATALVNEWEFVRTATSNFKGEFWFTGLEPGTYTIREDESSLGDMFQTSDQAEGNPNDFIGTSTGGQSLIGESPLDSSTDAIVIQSRQEFSWKADAMVMTVDHNGNGLNDPNEIAAANAAVALKAETVLGEALQWGNNFTSGSIEGFKFEDVNADGVYQAPDGGGLGGEPALSDVKFIVVDLSGNPVVGVNGMPVMGSSDANGIFTLSGLRPGTYKVIEDLSVSDSNGDGIADADQGMVQSTPDLIIDVIADQSATVTSTGDPIRYGNYVAGSIHGYKFLDLDADGVQDVGEGPFQLAAFELLDSGGNPVLTDAFGNAIGSGNGVVYTDAQGGFDFENLVPGSYTVIERLDLVDRNDVDGNGFPEGNGTPDDQEGLRASTPISFTVTIQSRQEYVYADGVSGIANTQSADPDSDPSLGFGDDIQNAFAGVELTNARNGSGITVGFSPIAGSFVYANAGGNTGFSSNDGPILNADFDTPVDEVSIDVIANSNGDVGQLVAFDTFGNVISFVQTPLMSVGETVTLSLSSSDIGQPIASVQAAGLGSVVPITVLLDNLTYAVNPLKTEVNVGDSLVFGNYYAGGVEGTKTQADSDRPAPGILLELRDMNGDLVATSVTDANGRYDFGDVDPGMYTVMEPVGGTVNGNVLESFSPVVVVVPHATVVTDASGTASLYEGLQSESTKAALAVENLISGSIHGIRTGADGVTPQPGITVQLRGPAGVLDTTITGPDGEFHFEDIDPRDSFPSGSFTVTTADGEFFVYSPQVGSGVEVAYAPGEGDVGPGQVEEVDPGLIFAGDIDGSVHGIVFGDGAGVVGLDVHLVGVSDTTTVQTDSSGRFDFEGIDPGAYTIQVAGQTIELSGGVILSGEEEAFGPGQAGPLEPGQFETTNGNLIIDLGSSPEVVSVRLASVVPPSDPADPLEPTVPRWEPGFLEAIDAGVGLGYELPIGSSGSTNPLSWANINQVIVQFSKHVEGSGAGGALTIGDFDFASDLGGVSIVKVEYDSANFIAKLTLNSDLPLDRYSVRVEDAIQSQSGLALDGGDFVYDFAVSPGNASFLADSDLLGKVDFLDLGGLVGSLGTSAGDPGYLFTTDLNGNGDVDFLDLGFLVGELNEVLPPPASPFAASVDAFFGSEDDEDLLSEELEESISTIF